MQTGQTGQTYIGLKLSDVGANDPANLGKDLFRRINEENGHEYYKGVQSYDNCYIQLVLLDNEMKELVQNVL